MFDRYSLGGVRTEYVEKTVNIKRAPTDESIRLYEEIKDKAYKSILNTIGGDIVNIVNFKAFEINQNWNSFEKVAYYRFIMNDQIIEGNFEINRFSREDIVMQIYRNLAESIAKEFLRRSLIDGSIKHLYREV